MDSVKRIVCIVFVLLCLGVAVYVVAEEAENDNAESTEVKGVPAKTQTKLEEQIAKLPEDGTRRLTVMELRISGNSLISTEGLLKKMPLLYNASDKPFDEAEPNDRYDFRTLHDVISQPNQPQQVSARTIKGFTRYVLSVYRKKGYAGILVYVPEEVLEGREKLRDDVLLVRVLEATISEITITQYGVDYNEVEAGYLDPNIVQEWSPAKEGGALNRKKVDDFVSLLNLNPDRYASAIVSKGLEPNTVALKYDIYEANPWHYYIQVDNSGTEEREWAPRIGLINTNVTGRDDRFTAMYQAPWEKGIEDNYALFGSYDVPVFTPWLRLNLYAGYSEFDVTPEGGPFNFLGRGSFYGGIVRYNVLQTGGWFLDVTGSLSHEKSKVTPSLFPTAGSDVKFDLWGIGVNLYRSDDMSSVSLGFNRIESFDASDRDEFELARIGSEPDFAVYITSAYLSQYLDPNKVQRLSGSFRWITSDDRLVPAKMTSFGGLYSVRGYDEYEFVADGGILASVQYEFDLIKHEQSKEVGGEIELSETEPNEVEAGEEPRLRKLAPLVFVDYGRAKIKDRVAGEKSAEEFASVGVGTIVEIGENFSGAVYYGYPLMATDDTSEGKGRLNVSLILRF